MNNDTFIIEEMPDFRIQFVLKIISLRQLKVSMKMGIHLSIK